MGSGGQLGLYSEYFPEEEMGRLEYEEGNEFTEMEVEEIQYS